MIFVHFNAIICANLVIMCSALIDIKREEIYKNIPEDGRLNFTKLVMKYGYPVEEYDVITDDGYILKLFHIPGDKKKPVFLMHGIIDSALTFILRGKTSLVIKLAQAGYDVWAGNARGSKYSRHHILLNPDKDKTFWDYSIQEIGFYDLPALIDFILKKTGQDRLSAIGHSQGNTVFYVLGATRPEYNNKIKVLLALAPICYLHNVKPPVSSIIQLAPTINKILLALNQEEIFGDRTLPSTIIKLVCTQQSIISYDICARGVFFPIGGNDADELEPEFFPVVIGHYPTGTSRKNLMHTAQIGHRNRFSQYDYGPMKNLQVYKSVAPPDYDLSKVTMKIALFAGRNDGLSSLKDVEILRNRLPNVVEYVKLRRARTNHIDYVWGRNMDIYLYPRVFEVLNKYLNS